MADTSLTRRIRAFLERSDAEAVTSRRAREEACETSNRAEAGWLFWCRYLAIDGLRRADELAEAVDRLLPLDPEKWPDALRAALGTIDGTQGNAPNWDTVFDLGYIFRRRFDITGDRVDLDRAIGAFAAMSAAVQPDPAVLLQLASHLICRAGSDDLDRADQTLRTAATLVGVGHPLRPQWWYFRVYERTLQFESYHDHERAAAMVDALTAGLDELRPNEAVREQIMALGRDYLVELAEALNGNDVTRASGLAYAVFAAGDPRLGAALSMLGSDVAVSIETATGPARFHEAIELLSEAVAAADGAMKAVAAGQLGNVYLSRLERFGDREDARAAVAAFRESVRVMPAGHESQSWSQINLAAGLLELDEAAALDEAIALLATIADVDPATRGRACMQLGRAYSTRWQRSGDIAALHAAIDHNRTAVAAEPPNSHGRVDALNNLATTLLHRYRAFDTIDDLHEAIALLDAARGEPDIFPARRLRTLANLATALMDRFNATGSRADATTGLRLAREAAAVDLPPLLAARQADVLGGMLVYAYEISGSTGDLYEGIRIIRSAISADARPAVLVRLGAALLIRYEHTAATADLNEATGLLRRATATTGPHVAQALMNLSNALEMTYRVTGDRDVLVAAVDTGQAALDRGCHEPGRTSYVTNLAKAYGTLHQATGDLAPLDAAIDLERTALVTGSRDDWRRPRHLSNLAAHLMLRAYHTGHTVDLEEAIGVLRESAAATSTSDPRYATNLLNLGLALHSRYQRDRTPDDLDEGLSGCFEVRSDGVSEVGFR